MASMLEVTSVFARVWKIHYETTKYQEFYFIVLQPRLFNNTWGELTSDEMITHLVDPFLSVVLRHVKIKRSISISVFIIFLVKCTIFRRNCK